MTRTIALSGLLIAVALGLHLWSPPHAPILDEDTLPTSVPTLSAAQAPITIDALRESIAKVLEREGVPGAGIALVDRDGPIWAGGVGVADLETRQPVTASTTFRIASITKTIVGLGVMRLVEQGKLDLDRPLRELLPDTFCNPWEDESPVTLAQVIEHTAGLDDMRPSETFVDDDAMSTTQALSLNARSRTIRWRPGSRMSYSNVGYTLAARAIEVVTGEPFDVWLRREVMLPLGMGDADFRRTDVLAARLATGYIDRDRPAAFRPIAHRAAGSVLASASELSREVQFWLRRGEGFPSIVSPAGLARIERPGTLGFPAIDISYGLGNYGDVGHPIRSRGHDGGLPGFASSMRYFPELGRGYVMLLNATHSLRAYFEIRALLFAFLAHGKTVPIAIPTAAAPQTEFYAYANPRNALLGFLETTLVGWRASATPTGVHLDPLIGREFDMVSAADGGYRFPSESGSSARFAQQPDGTKILIAGFGYAERASYAPARVACIALAIAMLLLQLAPWWAAGTLVIAAVRGKTRAVGLVLWPAIAGLSLLALPRVLEEASVEQRLGDVCLLTISVWALSILFAVASVLGLYSAVRWSIRPDRPSWLWRVVPTAMVIAAFGVALWLDHGDIIGLRTWAW